MSFKTQAGAGDLPWKTFAERGAQPCGKASCPTNPLIEASRDSALMGMQDELVWLAHCTGASTAASHPADTTQAQSLNLLARSINQLVSRSTGLNLSFGFTCWPLIVFHLCPELLVLLA